MRKIDPHLLARLKKISAQLAAIVAECEAAEPVFPPSAAKLMEQRMCLAGNHAVPQGERYDRGNCTVHRKALKDLVSDGQYTEDELIAHGKLAPPEKGGRKATRKKEAEKLLNVFTGEPPETFPTSKAQELKDALEEAVKNHGTKSTAKDD